MTEVYDNIRKFWDSEPCGTTHINLPIGTKEYFIEFDKYFKEFYPYLLPFLDLPSLKGKNVLEIGLGSGFELQQIAGAAKQTTVLDISAETIKLCEMRKVHFGINFDSINTSATKIPLPNASVDVVVSIGCIHHIPEIKLVIDEIHRVLRPGGKFMGMVYNKNSWRYRFIFPFFTWLIYPQLRRKSMQEKINIVYDGANNPYGMVYSKSDIKGLFGQFHKLNFEVNNFTGEELFKVGRFIPRRILLNTIGKTLGLDLYFKALKGTNS